MRILLIFFFTLAFLGKSELTSAQYYREALGARAGTTFGLAYKNYFFRRHSVEGIAGLRLDRGYVLEGLYQYTIDLGFDTRFGAYAGLGAGVIFPNKDPEVKFGGGLIGMIGVEYTFKFVPVNISVDYKPYLGYKTDYKMGAFTVRWLIPSRY